MGLQIIRALPNPSGKERQFRYSVPSWLNTEWVDLGNTGRVSVWADDYTLGHLAFPAGRNLVRRAYWRGPHVMVEPGDIVRVHTGSLLAWRLGPLRAPSDVRYLAFAGARNFVLNNTGDSLLLNRVDQLGRWRLADSAFYTKAGEGEILYR